MPVETALGRKRRIDASACNADLSCLAGFCPSFVTLSGARLAPDQADAIVERFLATGFEGGRHARRVDQITELDSCG
jgi:hypothetical protein